MQAPSIRRGRGGPRGRSRWISTVQIPLGLSSVCERVHHYRSSVANTVKYPRYPPPSVTKRRGSAKRRMFCSTEVDQVVTEAPSGRRAPQRLGRRLALLEAMTF